jgi:ferredoxin-NADP reductase
MLDRGESGNGSGNVGLNQAAASPPPAWVGFRALRVAAKSAETTTVSSLWLADVDDASLPAAQPGQSVAVRLRPDGAATAMIRSYSLSGEPGSDEYRISVKRETDGAASAYLHDHVHAGDTIDVAAPRGVFTLASGNGPVVLASAGIGVTPVLAMLHTLATQRSVREVWWLHGARNSTEHAFAREAQALLAELPFAHTHVCYSQPALGDRLGESYTSSGRLSGELVDRLGIPRLADAYLCGPQAFMTELGAALVGLGFEPSHIHTETFGALGVIRPGVT